MSDLHEQIIEHLTFAIRRDAEKGGIGLRTTQEIAERQGVTTSIAARALEALHEDGKVDFYGKFEGLGNHNYWGLADGMPGGREAAPAQEPMEIAA